MKNYNKPISSEKIYSILKKPITTEKSTNLQQFNQYTFLVSKESKRHEIKQAIEKIFKVKKFILKKIINFFRQFVFG